MEWLTYLSLLTFVTHDMVPHGSLVQKRNWKSSKTNLKKESGRVASWLLTLQCSLKKIIEKSEKREVETTFHMAQKEDYDSFSQRQLRGYVSRVFLFFRQFGT